MGQIREVGVPGGRLEMLKQGAAPGSSARDPAPWRPGPEVGAEVLGRRPDGAGGAGVMSREAPEGNSFLVRAPETGPVPGSRRGVCGGPFCPGNFGRLRPIAYAFSLVPLCWPAGWRERGAGFAHLTLRAGEWGASGGLPVGEGPSLEAWVFPPALHRVAAVGFPSWGC